MHSLHLLPALSLAIALTVVGGAGLPLANAKPTSTTPVKFHPLTPVPIQNVTINDAFWSPKRTVWQAKTINDTFDKFEGSGAFENFDRVAAKQTGGHKGDPWWDGLVYETITGAADFLAAHPNSELQKRLEGYVARITAAAAADPDGYVNTGATLNHIGVRWSNPPTPGDDHNDNFPHTIYNAGCLVEAGIHLYRATGQTQLLQVGTRLANYMCGIMGPAPKQNIIPGHAIPEQAFVNLYRLYHEQPALKARVGVPVDENAYLKLAEFWIENRGHTEGRKGEGAYNQDDKPVFEQAAMEGHAVRAGLLASGIATAASVNQRPEYLATGARWWQNMVDGKMYITGGLGAIPSMEGFGADYELPNEGYAETCAAVAGGFFSQNMNLATGDAKYVDILERELYNGALSGVSLSGDRYFYTNYLRSGPNHRRWSWLPEAGTPCCPPMFLKLQGGLPGYIYATDAAGVYVNLYVGSKARIAIGKSQLELGQTTNYPWDGRVKMMVTPQTPSRFTLHLRIPGWVNGASVELNGKPIKSLVIANNYAQLERTWKKGDTVTLHLPMPVERVKADPRVAADVGRVALMRGPIVYCLEGTDNGGPINSLLLPSDAAIQAEHRSDLLGGVTVLKGTAQRLSIHDAEVKALPTQFTAIPFYANSNREPTDMEVWVADDKTQVVPMTLAREATASASHCFGNDTVAALNDGVSPAKSDDETISRMTWWDHRGTQEWGQLTFKGARRLSGTDVYWWDERRVGRQCRVPQSWKLQYLDGDQWKDVTNASGYGTQMDTFNHVSFDTVNTTALRVVVQLQPEWSGGILEWRVNQ
ncbi:non-reducing end beta-L-arabinofuranosidase [Abditibacteriota bacterium]|nr:non-reducing end beta-L-arabinofuranosidase [Abditibacteriota bacterium]